MQLCAPTFTETDRSLFCCEPDCGCRFDKGDVIYLVEFGSTPDDYTHVCWAHLIDAVPDGREITWVQAIQEPQIKHIDVLFDGPPGPTPGRFVEVENETRASIRAGEWIEREDGYWVLRIPVPAGWLVG